MEPDKNRKRSLRNLLIEPKAQLSFAASIIFINMIFSVIFIFTFIDFIENFVLDACAISLDCSNAWASVDVKTVKITSLVGILFFSFITLFLVLKRTHRIYGPMVSIVRHIQRLQNGNYSSRLQLRHTDDFAELASNLNALSEFLEKNTNHSQGLDSK